MLSVWFWDDLEIVGWFGDGLGELGGSWGVVGGGSGGLWGPPKHSKS